MDLLSLVFLSNQYYTLAFILNFDFIQVIIFCKNFIHYFIAIFERIGKDFGFLNVNLECFLMDGCNHNNFRNEMNKYLIHLC